MSKIKDLLAIENDIDDLKPVKKVEDTFIDRSRLLKNLEHVIWDNAKVIRQELYERAEYDEWVDEEGHKNVEIRNFDEVCEQIAEGFMESYVYHQQIDISDEAYDLVLSDLKSYTVDCFDDYYMELIKEAEEKI